MQQFSGAATLTDRKAEIHKVRLSHPLNINPMLIGLGGGGGESVFHPRSRFSANNFGSIKGTQLKLNYFS